jgi:pyruvate formate lyase activating enzyme
MAGELATLKTEWGEELDRSTVEGILWRREGDAVRCLACGHRCRLHSGRRGICKVRFNQAGTLRVPFGYVAGLNCDPVEKKPFFHLVPGSTALTFGMLGCNLHCAFCQNWISSQTLRHPEASTSIHPIRPEQIVSVGRQRGARLVVSSYNEPLITVEWAAAVFKVAADHGMLGAFVSNGHASPEVLDYLRPRMRAIKVDLKTFDDQKYRSLGGTLQQVTSTIQRAFELGFWVEVVTLLVPGFNDSAAELRQIADFLSGISPDIPWHVTAYHPDYQMTDRNPTRVEELHRAAEIGVKAGLRYVYAGNRPGQVGEWEHTRCPSCGVTLVEREGFRVVKNRITAGGDCYRCQNRIAGIWAVESRGS